MLKFVAIALLPILFTFSAQAESTIPNTKLKDADARDIDSNFVREEGFGMEIIQDGKLHERFEDLFVQGKVSPTEMLMMTSAAEDLSQLSVRDLHFELGKPGAVVVTEDNEIALSFHVSVKYIKGGFKKIESIKDLAWDNLKIIGAQGTMELKGTMKVAILDDGAVSLKFLEFDSSQGFEEFGRALGLHEHYDGDFGELIAGPMMKAYFSDKEKLRALLEGDYDSEAPLP